jgi:hypothetical protein
MMWCSKQLLLWERAVLQKLTSRASAARWVAQWYVQHNCHRVGCAYVVLASISCLLMLALTLAADIVRTALDWIHIFKTRWLTKHPSSHSAFYCGVLVYERPEAESFLLSCCAGTW